MTSRFRQYLDEVRTCSEMAVDRRAFLGLVGRTAEFHLNNMAQRVRQPSALPERHRVVLDGHHRDLWIRPRTGDLFIFHEVFANQCYRIPTALLSDARTVVDLGANIGLTTLFLSQLFPDARYICVEPNPSNAAVLRRNVDWLGDHVVVIESAIANYSGNISFTDSDWSWGGHIVPGETACRVVPCLSLDDLLTLHHIQSVDLLKVDTEGAERLIFSARPECLRNVRCIVIELHNGYAFSEFEEDVRPLGFTAIPGGSTAGNAMHMAISDHRNLKEMANF